MGLTNKFNSKMTAEDFCIVDIQQLIQSLKIINRIIKLLILRKKTYSELSDLHNFLSKLGRVSC